MPQHRDDSKAEFPEGRTGKADGGMGSKASQIPDDQKGVWGRPEGYGLSPAETDDVPDEERTVSQSGGASSQPAATKAIASDEAMDQQHFDRDHIRPDHKSSENDRSRGARVHGAEPPPE